MSWLSDLVANAGRAAKLPEWGISEKLGGQDVRGAMTSNGGSVNIGGRNVPTAYNATDYNRQMGYSSARPVANATGTTGGGGSSGGFAGGGGIAAAPATNPNADAERAYQARLGLIQQKLNMIRDTAGRTVERARGLRDEIKGNVDTTYGTLKKSVQDRLGTVLGNLDQEQIGVENTYGQASAKARKSIENAILSNRMKARAMNRLDSSFYDERQADLNDQGIATQNSLSDEEAQKITGIGTRRTEAKNEVENKLTSLDTEAASLKSQADRDLQAQVDAANDIERNAGIDMSADIENAYQEHRSRLQAIQDRAEGIKMNILGILTQNQTSAQSFINNYNAINPALERILGMTGGLASAQNLDTTITPNVFTSPTPTNGNLANIGRDLEEEKKRLAQYGLA